MQSRPDLTNEYASPLDLVRWGWLRGELRWKLHASQRLIYEALSSLEPSVKQAVVLCSRRFGKSYLGVILALERCLREPRRIVRIIGPDIKQTKMIVEEAMTKITADLAAIGKRDLVRPIKSENRYMIGESNLYLGGFDSQEDSLRGGEAHEILVEETGSSNPEQYNYQMRDVLKPQLLKTRGRMIHLTTLPKETDHPFIMETMPEAELKGSFYSFTIYDDPLATPEIIQDAIDDCAGAHTIAFQREYMNKVVRDPNIVVVPTFSKARHVSDAPGPTDCRWQVQIDWGGTVDKTVAQLMTYDFLQDLDIVEDELVWDANTPTSAIVAELMAWERYVPEQRVADCHGQTQIDLNHDHSYAVVSPQKSDWQSSINQLVARFARDKIRIRSKCKFTIQSLESGRLTKNRKDFERTPTLGHCDAIAAIMYGVRCLDRTNPFPYEAPPGPRSTSFARPREPEEQAMAEAIVGRTFGGAKRFGAFK